MSDAAAFFAKKKKGGKKKSFKAFNANKIDVTAVASTVHVDAPAISDSAFSANLSSSGPTTSDAPKLVDEDWATPEQKAPTTNKLHPKRGAVTELLDMNALEARRREEDDVVERLRVEQTKAALNSARVGMEKEALRLKEEEEAKKFKTVTKAPTRSNIGGGGTKWLPPHLRGGPSAALGNSRSMFSKARGDVSINTKDDNDFPDLASANAAIEEQKRLEKEQADKERARIASRKANGTPWGAGKPKSTIGSNSGSNSGLRQRLKIAPKKGTEVTQSEGAKVEEASTVVKPSPLPDTPKISAITSTPAPEASAAPVPVIPVEKTIVKKKKKKKKDLSTFQTSS